MKTYIVHIVGAGLEIKASRKVEAISKAEAWEIVYEWLWENEMEDIALSHNLLVVDC